MKRCLVRLGCCAGLAGAVLLGSCASQGTAPAPTNFMARHANARLDELKNGHRTYQQHCVRCHDTVPEPPLGRMWHSPEMGLDLYMSLTDLERHSVLEYIKAVDALRFQGTRSIYDAY